MSHPRQYQMVGGGGGGGGGNATTQFGDTTYTKIFVGGLAWETQRETLKRYFEQFGEILEAVVITDKVSGKSKGYGFVTFKDPDSAMRACQDPSPVIDGRRANCNIASLGAHKSRPSPSHHHGTERLRPPSGSMGKPSHHHHHGSSTNFRQSNPQFSFPPYSIYGYSGYPQELYAMNYYNVYSGQQISSYYSSPSGSTAAGVYYGYYPVYTQQQGQSSQIQGFGIQYPQSTTQYPYLPQPYQAVGILPLPASVSASSSSSSSSSSSMGATTTATGEVTRTTAAATEQGS